MPRIYPTDWKTQLKIFELYGCKYKRKEGSHHVLTCPGVKRAVVTKAVISKVIFLSLFVIAACPQSFWFFQKDSRQAGMTSM